TGGRVLVLGPAGRNFGAGMSGGVAWVLDSDKKFRLNVNTEMIGIEPLTEEDSAEIRALIEKHVQHTGSAVGKRLLDEGPAGLAKFVKVLPKDYKRMMKAIKSAHASGLTGEEAIMAAFEQNARDFARVGGN